MTNPRLRLCRSLLFLPASNSRAIEKARTLNADMVILDCEDAVREDEKEQARAQAIAAVGEGFGDRLSAIRINAPASPFYGPDVVALRASKADFVVLPKAEAAGQVKDTANLTGKPVLAMIETASGVLHANEIAMAADGLIAGTNDLAADLRLPPGASRAGLVTSLQNILIAARARGIAAFDGVYNGLADDEGLGQQCREGREFGFDGKSLIHPSQIDTANRIYGPSDAEVEAAARLIEAARGGAERYEGRMIEAMHIDQAQDVLAKARR
jgi:(3S)-malyl-CoA thioesterase